MKALQTPQCHSPGQHMGSDSMMMLMVLVPDAVTKHQQPPMQMSLLVKGKVKTGHPKGPGKSSESRAGLPSMQRHYQRAFRQ